jgi:hypothetical protein
MTTKEFNNLKIGTRLRWGVIMGTITRAEKDTQTGKPRFYVTWDVKNFMNHWFENNAVIKQYEVVTTGPDSQPSTAHKAERGFDLGDMITRVVLDEPIKPATKKPKPDRRRA